MTEHYQGRNVPYNVNNLLGVFGVTAHLMLIMEVETLVFSAFVQN